MIRADAYCEPPPQLPCPQGSHWTSTSVDDVYCHGGARCEEHDCGEDSTCRKTSLCVREVPFRRFGHYEVVLGTCSTDADCREGTKCVAASRCDLDTKRFHPKGVPNPAAKGPVSSAAPAQQSATPMLGPGTAAPGVTVIPNPDSPPQAEPGHPPPAGSAPATGCASCSLGAGRPAAPPSRPRSSCCSRCCAAATTSQRAPSLLDEHGRCPDKSLGAIVGGRFCLTNDERATPYRVPMAQPISSQAPLTGTLLDAIPLPLFVVDWDLSILDANQAAQSARRCTRAGPATSSVERRCTAYAIESRSMAAAPPSSARTAYSAARSVRQSKARRWFERRPSCSEPTVARTAGRTCW